MQDEGRTDELGDHPVFDLTTVEDDRAETSRYSDRAALRKAVERAKRPKERGPAAPRSDRDEEPDNAQEALDRDQAVLYRHQAELDRDQASFERSPTDVENELELLREQAVVDRDQAALDRDQARLDRAQAALDRLGDEQRDYLIDDLTGMLRRGPGLRELQHEIDRARRGGVPLVVAFIDVDGLKAVNDRRGHAAGDQLLRDMATAIRQGLRSYDLVLRYGGDEFVCALSNAGIDQAEHRLREVAGVLGAAPSHGSIAWGLAELRADDTGDDLVARADSALYRARRSRRDPTHGGSSKRAASHSAKPSR